MSASIFSSLSSSNIIGISDLNTVLRNWSDYGSNYIQRMFKYWNHDLQTPFLWNNGNTLSTNTVVVNNESSISLQSVNQIGIVDLSFNGSWVTYTQNGAISDTVIVPLLDNSGNEIDGEFLASMIQGPSDGQGYYWQRVVKIKFNLNQFYWLYIQQDGNSKSAELSGIDDRYDYLSGNESYELNSTTIHNTWNNGYHSTSNSNIGVYNIKLQYALKRQPKKVQLPIPQEINLPGLYCSYINEF